MIVPVAKYHGCGNDFILISDETAKQIDDLASFAISVCDRHTGIGADGLIAARENPLFMEYYNQDGTRAPMCGNGIRCLSRYLFEHGHEGQTVFEIDTLAGLKTVTVESSDPFFVRVNMGKPDDDPAAISADTDEKIVNRTLYAGSKPYTVDSMFMATVHTVTYDENAMGDIEEAGKALCYHPLYKELTNVNFVHVIDRTHIEVQTYERGCGVTLACGTGVCASAVSARRRGLVDDAVRVRLKKGELRVEIDPDETVWMIGPAEKVMEGDYFWNQESKGRE